MSSNPPFGFPPVPPPGMPFPGAPFPPSMPPMPVQQPRKVRGPKPVEQRKTKPNDTECETLYVSNLNERVGIKKLKTHLTTLFSSYNPVEVKAKYSNKLRGQAWISFGSIEDAKQAKESLDGREVFGKPIMISYALKPSDKAVFSKSQEEGKKYQRERWSEKVKKIAERKASKMASQEEESSEEETTKPSVQMEENLPPNKILFVQQIPEHVTADQLKGLFGFYQGFVDLRPIPGRHDIAFVEYADEGIASQVKAALAGYKVGEQELKVGFAKK